MRNCPRPVGTLLLVATALWVGAGSAQALPHASYDLRALAVWHDLPPDADPGVASTSFLDLFDNGNPLLGGAYGKGWSGQGSYTPLGHPQAAAEATGPLPDFFGSRYGMGRMRFQFGDAVPVPSNLDKPGFVRYRETLGLNAVTPPLLSRDRSFNAVTGWDFAAPEAGTAYGMHLTDNPCAALCARQSFDDLIDLRVVRGGDGLPRIALRRLTWDGSLLSVSDQAMANPAAFLLPGHALSEAALIDLEFDYDAAMPGTAGRLQASFWLQDANDVGIGGGDLPLTLSIFHGEDTTRVAASAVWSAPVPETGTWALTMIGLGLLTLRTRPHLRRRR